LVGGAGQLLAEVTGPQFDGAKEFAVGGIDEGVRELLQQGGRLLLESGEEALTPRRAVFWEGRRG
jgi:hypothetical protein